MIDAASMARPRVTESMSASCWRRRATLPDDCARAMARERADRAAIVATDQFCGQQTNIRARA